MTDPNAGTLLVDQRVEMRLVQLGPFGECLGYYRGNEIAVFGGIPGEKVIAQIVRLYHNQVSARVVDVTEPSPHRITPDCPYFWPCTGCQWQHIEYPHQLKLKQLYVETTFSKFPELIGVNVAPPIPSVNQYSYRNHARFTVGPGGNIGFVNRITRRFTQINRCLLMHEKINGVLNKIQGKCSETTQVAVRVGVNTGDILVQPAMGNPDLPVSTGQKSYKEMVLDQTFTVASPSFFQVNTPQIETLINFLKAHLAPLADKTLVDAYSGVGTFTALLASECKRVIAVEESASAVRDAKINCDGHRNVEFYQGKTEHILGRLDDIPDILILDPPRSGCQPGTLDSINQVRPAVVAYVSCDPATMARDLAVLVREAYRIDFVQPIDLFPQTHHIECVVLLSRFGS